MTNSQHLHGHKFRLIADCKYKLPDAQVCSSGIPEKVRVCEGFNFASSFHFASLLPRLHSRGAYCSRTSQHHDLELHCSGLHTGTGNAKLNVVEIIAGNTKWHTLSL